MSLTRILESQAMDSDEEARDYDAMDHAGVNATFCADLLKLTSERDPILDVGTGTALILIELCRRAPRARVVATDLAESMLRFAVREMRRVVGRGGILFIRDLIRPETEEAVRTLVERYVANVNPNQRALFEASLRAAFTLDEVRGLAGACGIPTSAVRQTSDRHWTLAYSIGSEQA